MTTKRKRKAHLTVKGLVARQFRDDLRAEELERRRKEERVKPIYSQKRREAAVEAVSDLLGQWRLSPFENQGACQNGIRSAFCLDGHPWPQSQTEAERIVIEALRRNGAETPSWKEGQPEYVIPRENCNNCARPLDDMQIARGSRFCCVGCANAVLERRNFERTWREDEAGRAAKRMVLRERGDPRTCAKPGCGRSFFPALNNPGQRFCSLECYEPRQKLPPRQCRSCGKTYAPRHKGQVYCSKGCNSEGGISQPKQATCVCCARPFVSYSNRAGRFCSKGCKSTDYQYRHGKTIPRRHTPAAFDYFIAGCAA